MRQGPPRNIYISRLRDQTRPFDSIGLLALDTTMMATTAVDRLGTNRLTVVGSEAKKDGALDTLVIVGSFTELNRTIHSGAIGGAARLGDFEVDLSADREWNNIALDLGLVENTKLLNGMTVSVNITVEGGSGEGNFVINPGDEYSGVISMGYTGREGIHAAQRLLIESAIGLLIGKYYGVDLTRCIGDAGRLRNKPDLYKQDVVFNENGYESAYIQNRLDNMDSLKQRQNYKTPGPISQTVTPRTPEKFSGVALQYPPPFSVSSVRRLPTGQSGQSKAGNTTGYVMKSQQERNPASVSNDANGAGQKVCSFESTPFLETLLTTERSWVWEGQCSPSGLITGPGTLIVVGRMGDQILHYQGMTENGFLDGWGTLKTSFATYRGIFSRSAPTENMEKIQ